MLLPMIDCEYTVEFGLGLLPCTQFLRKLCETMWPNQHLGENQLDNLAHKHIEQHQFIYK